MSRTTADRGRPGPRGQPLDDGSDLRLRIDGVSPPNRVPDAYLHDSTAGTNANEGPLGADADADGAAVPSMPLRGAGDSREGAPLRAPGSGQSGSK